MNTEIVQSISAQVNVLGNQINEVIGHIEGMKEHMDIMQEHINEMQYQIKDIDSKYNSGASNLILPELKLQTKMIMIGDDITRIKDKLENVIESVSYTNKTCKIVSNYFEKEEVMEKNIKQMIQDMENRLTALEGENNKKVIPIL